jgi:hypothetical protein
VGFSLGWASDVSGRVVRSPQDLDILLDEADAAARAGKPLIAVLAGDDGRSLSIALGREGTVLSSTGPDGMPPYCLSDSGTGDETPIVYFFFGHWTEFPAWSSISMAQGREAMHHYLATGELHPELRWRET